MFEFINNYNSTKNVKQIKRKKTHNYITVKKN